MPEIDKLTIEIANKSKDASNEVGVLISKLEKLSNMTDGIASALKDTAKGITSMRTSLNKLNQLDMAKVNKQVDGLVKNLNKLGKVSFGLRSTSEELKTMSKAMNSLTRSMDKLSQSQNVKGLDLSKMTFNVNQYQKMASSMGGIKFRGFNTFALGTSLTVLGRAFGKTLRNANDFIETINLFDVVMGSSANKAYEFTKSLESLGVDMNQAMHYQSTFYDIGKSLGMSAKNAYTLSEQFTKLSYDYASLYNLPVDEAFQKLQAATVGTVEPIRRLGKDISEAHLRELALTLGIEENVRTMTASEKATLRFIAVMQQSGAAMNDMERTINSPANSLRVLKAQFHSLSREIGALFIPMLTSTMPYLIAFAKLLREIVNDIAMFFGIAPFELDFSGIDTSIGIADDYSNGLADNLDKGSKSAKKIKEYMLGIDELNVLNPNQGADSTGKDKVPSGIGGGDLGLDLEKFGYKQVLKDVQSRADAIYQTLRKWKTPLEVAAGILGTMWAVGKVAKFINALKGVRSASTTLMGAKGIGGLARAFFNLAGTGGALGMASTGFVVLGDTILTGLGIVTGSTLVAGLTGLGVVLGVVGLAAVGVHEALKPAVKQLDELANVSDTTRSKLEPVIDTWKELDKSVTKLDWSDKVIDDKDVKDITGKVKKMVDSVLKEVDSDRNQELQDIELLKQAKGISEETYQSIKNDTNKYYDDIMKETEFAEKRINEILTTAKDEKRALTEKEADELKKLQEKIRDNAVTTMSESEKEQLDIMNRLKYNKKVLTVESGSELLQEAKKNKEAQLKEADDWRVRMLASLDKRFGDEATMSNAEYAKQKQAIEDTYKDMTKKADDGYININNEVKKGLGDQYYLIDEKTGKIKSNWRVWLDGMAKAWNDMWSGLGTWWQSKIDGLNKWWKGMETKWNEWKKEMNKKWEGFWGGLKTTYQNVTDGLGRWWNGIKTSWDEWKKGFSKGWDDFWSGLKTSWDNSGIKKTLDKIGGLFGTESRMGVDVDYGIGSVQQPSLMAFASGGIVPSARNFVSPDMWTAGEAGKELIGSYKGKTTVMPLEHTSFVQAMYQAVYDATRDAYSEHPIDITVNPTVNLEGRDIKQAEERYTYKTGTSLVTRR